MSSGRLLGHCLKNSTVVSSLHLRMSVMMITMIVMTSSYLMSMLVNPLKAHTSAWPSRSSSVTLCTPLMGHGWGSRDSWGDED